MGRGFRVRPRGAASVADGAAGEPLSLVADIQVPQVDPQDVDDDDSRAREIEDTDAAVRAIADQEASVLADTFGAPDEGLIAALDSLDRGYRLHSESVRAVVASAQRDRGATSGDALAASAIEALREAVSRPQPAPVVTVHPAPVTVESPVVNVTTPPVTVEAPVVNVQTPETPVTVEAPVLNVTLPEQAAPVINVAAPVVEMPAAAPPDVHVHVEQQARGPVRVEFDAQGNKVFVPVEGSGAKG